MSSEGNIYNLRVGRLILAAACLAAGSGIEKIIPESIPVHRSGLETLTAGLRARTSSLGLNGERAAKALVLLPADRAKAGVVSFEIEEGPWAGMHQCEVLGRGKTSTSLRPGWVRSSIEGREIFYAPMEAEGGATIPGVYDVRNIDPRDYEISFLDGKGDAGAQGGKPYFSGVWRHWYPKSAGVFPIDMIWAEDAPSPYPVRENRPSPKDAAGRERMEKQLASDRRYYFGPFGRAGFANHTDQWDDPDRASDPRYEGRPELKSFLWRDTNGCLKVRPDCLALLNRFIDEQARKGRRVQYDVRETPLLDSVPNR
jgi:hypothetical protein